MRLPVVHQISTKDGTSNKNARLTNTLKETRQTGELAVVRPGLETAATSAGNGNGLVCFNGELISLYGNAINIKIDSEFGVSISTTDSVFQMPAFQINYHAGKWYAFIQNEGLFDGGETTFYLIYTSTDFASWSPVLSSVSYWAEKFVQVGTSLVSLGTQMVFNEDEELYEEGNRVKIEIDLNGTVSYTVVAAGSFYMKAYSDSYYYGYKSVLGVKKFCRTTDFTSITVGDNIPYNETSQMIAGGGIVWVYGSYFIGSKAWVAVSSSGVTLGATTDLVYDSTGIYFPYIRAIYTDRFVAYVTPDYIFESTDGVTYIDHVVSEADLDWVQPYTHIVYSSLSDTYYLVGQWINDSPDKPFYMAQSSNLSSWTDITPDGLPEITPVCVVADGANILFGNSSAPNFGVGTLAITQDGSTITTVGTLSDNTYDFSQSPI
jgi:hypothetical protein